MNNFVLSCPQKSQIAIEIHRKVQRTSADLGSDGPAVLLPAACGEIPIRVKYAGRTAASAKSTLSSLCLSVCVALSCAAEGERRSLSSLPLRLLSPFPLIPVLLHPRSMGLAPMPL
jgi:hypothetical protein